MKQISKIKYFVFVFLMSFTLIASAEYTVKVFIDGLSVNTTTTPVVEDGDTTEQAGGEAGELTFTVSRTSGYNHNSYILTITSNAYNCFNITQKTVLGRFPYEYCDMSYPYVENLDLSTTIPGVYTFEIQALNEYGGAAIKTYTFNLEVLAIPDGEESDSELSFGYYRKVIEQGGSFSVNINSSTFNCYEINILTDNYGPWESGCPSDGYPYATTVDLSSDFPDFTGNIELEVVGYNIDETTWEMVDRKSYPFSVTVNPGDISPVLEQWNLENGATGVYNSFMSPHYGYSNYYKNNLLIQATKTKEIKVDIPSIGYTTGWSSANTGGEHVREIIAPYTGYFDVKLSLRNGTTVVEDTKSLFLEGNEIKDFSIDLCNSGANNCDDFTNSMAIWAGGEGTSASLTFRATNVDCVTIQSNDDLDYNTPVEKCWGDSGGTFAVFDMDYPNHDAVGRVPKDYVYNFSAINSLTGEEFTDTYTVNIYYD